MSFAKDFTKVCIGDSKSEAKQNAIGLAALGITTGLTTTVLTQSPTAGFNAAVLGTVAVPAGIATIMAGRRMAEKTYIALRDWANS